MNPTPDVEIQRRESRESYKDVDRKNDRHLGPQEPQVVTVEEQRDLKRHLSQRHVSMIALAGALGTGLFIGLGSSIQTGGPLGALLGYSTIGLLVCAVQFALGETAALFPLTGGFVRHADLITDPALGFAVGWNLVYGNLLSIPSEITAICVLFQLWTDVSPAVFIVIFIVLTVAVGMVNVRVFGEVEFGFAMLKILLVIFLIIFGLIVNLGGVPGTERIGFRYWENPGPFVEYVAAGAWGRFLGYWSCMGAAVFSFAGTESIAMAAAETRNPSRALPRACKRVFARVLLFYVLAVLVVGMLTASNDERLGNDSGTAAQSPFVIAASAAGYPAVGSFVNAIVITSAWSSSNQALLAGTRVLYGLALKGQAPRIFLRTTSWGTPYVCVALFASFMFLAFLSLSSSALTVFYWLLDLVAAGVLVSWITILTNHLRLRLALKKQGVDRTELPWSNRWTLHSSIAGLVFAVIVLLTNGWKVFTKGHWSPSDFVSAYVDIPLVLTVFALWKCLKRTRHVKLDEIPILEALNEIQEFNGDDENVARGWKRAISWLWE
ncbi:amino acid permease [Ceraceosorus guamensis]|uniref:Amino acid permease n=1 Tax=Ceraceosorus guamensis TaxID=1522189 RepID=A0A316W275_9BASI|nr:amino acid permease [Ceraceosorus guamensis]PWN42661.1 amino acid permease [Ceraceosorus guamensis]